MRYHISFIYKDSFIFYEYKPVITADTYLKKIFPDMVVDKKHEKYVKQFIASLKDNVFPTALYKEKYVFIFPTYSIVREMENYITMRILEEIQNKQKISLPLDYNLNCFKELNILVYIDTLHWNIPKNFKDIKKMMHIVKYPGIKRFHLEIKRKGIYNTLSINGKGIKTQDVMKLSGMGFGDTSRLLFIRNNGISGINIDTTKYIKNKNYSVSSILKPYTAIPDIELIF